MSIEIGSWVWVPDEDDYVVPAQVVSLSAGESGKFKLQNGTVRELSGASLQNLQELDTQCLDENVSNLIGLSNLSENALLHNLRIRFKADSIYTFVSSILIAVNPFRQLPIYGVETLERYRSTVDKSTLPPHIFTIADNAYKAMVSDGTSQSVVISGESGAGKTESTKLLLEFLAELSGKANQEGDSIQQQILQCNPVMEAFGNAKTVRNNNSSRFGKLITIRFSHGSIKGASIISYLLEKSRVVHQQSGERNYHYFYQLVAAAAVNKDLAKELMFSEEDEHFYVSQSGVNVIEGLSDLEEYNEVQSAMEVLGMTEEMQMSVSKVVAGILHIGNIKFDSTDTSGDVAAKIEDPSQIDKVSSLLGFNREELQRCLTSRNIGTRSIITCTYTPSQALDARDALSKKLYANLFDWLIKAINDTLEGEGGVDNNNIFIAVLDIFGFEAFEHNSFEQLCINYCNEKLQFHFNNHIFMMEQEEYAREGVSVAQIKFEDNQATLDLLEVKPTGLFSMIDEEISVPRGSDESLLSKIFQKHSSHPNLNRAKAKVHKNVQDCFVVVHYAGEVAYNVTGFLEKNKDMLSSDLEDIGKHSTLPFVASLFQGSGDVAQAPKDEKPLKSRRPQMSKLNKRNTLGNQFRQQLATLMDTLNKTDPHFVRCMKPNMEKVGRKYNSQVMLAQLRYAGLLEVCRIRQMGFPNRMPFEKFMRQYLVLQPAATSAQTLADLLTKNGQLASDQYVVGNTKIFLKHAAASTLDSLRDQAYFQVAQRVQRIARGYLRRRRYALMHSTLLNLKKAVQERNAAALEDAVAQSVDLPYEGVHLPVVKEAKDLVRRFKEESKVNKLLEEAIQERQLASLEGALRTARNMAPPLSSPLVKRASDLVERVKEEKAHISSAAALMQSKDLDKLEAWMEKATSLDLLNSDTCRSVQAVIDRIQDEMSLLDDIESAMAAQNLQVLSAYIAKAAEMGLDNRAVFIEAKKFQHELEEQRSGTQALEVALETPHVESLQSAITKAKSCGVSSTDTLMQRAVHVHDILLKVKESEEALKRAVDVAVLDDLIREVRAAEEVMSLVRNESAFDGMSVEIQTLSSAQTLVDSLTKKKQADDSDLKQQDELAANIRAALQDKEFSYLRSMISQAKGMGLARGKHAALLKEADDVLEKMRIAMDVEMALVAAMRMKDVSALNAAIAKAEVSTGGSSNSLASAVRMRDELVRQDKILEEIKTALESKNVLALDRLLQVADELKIASRFVDDARILVGREGNVAGVQKLLSEANDLQTLSEAIDKAIQLGLSDEIVEAARARHAKLSAGSSIAEELKSAMKNLEVVGMSENGVCEDDIEPLRNALKQVEVSDDSVLPTSLKKQAEDALALATKQLELQGTLSQISDLTPLVEIKKALRTSADAGLKNFKGFAIATAILKRQQDESGGADMQRVMADEEFTMEKFDQAKEELYQEARQPIYVFSNYVNLRTPEEFAKGSMLNKRKIMDNFLKHQKSPIGRSLTNLSNDDNRNAIIAFKSLLGYCGDKAVTFPASQALDFLQIGVNNPLLRNELYLQAIKQINCNPSSYAQARAFHVLCLCCDVFPPMPDLYYYVLNFLLSHAESVAQGADPTPIQQMAAYALVRIQAMHNTDPENINFTVDVEAVEAYSARLPTLAKVYSPDDLLLGELLVAPDVDVEALIMLLCQILGIHLSRRSILGLYVVTTKSNALAPMTLLPDKDFFIGDICQAPLLQKYGRPIKFYIRRKLLGPSSMTQFVQLSDVDEEETEEQMQALIDLTFTQLALRVADDSIKIPDDKTMAHLAAIQLATEAEYIPGRVDIALGQGCLNFVSESMKEAQTPEYWGKLIADALHKCVNRDDDELKREYLSLLEPLPSAGKTSHVPDEVILGVDESGLHFINGESDDLQVQFTARYLEIRKFSVKASSIRFTFDAIDGSGVPYEVELVTPLNEEIAQYCIIYRQSHHRGEARVSVQGKTGPTAAAQSRLEKLAALK